MAIYGFLPPLPDDPARLVYLEHLRWPRGFLCPACGSTEAPYRFKARPSILRCRDCRRDASVAAGTVVEGSRLPLETWFRAARLVLTPIGVRELQAALGLSRYATAHRVFSALRERDPGTGSQRERFRAMLGSRGDA